MIEILSALFFVVGFYDFIVLNIILIRINMIRKGDTKDANELEGDAKTPERKWI